LINQEADHRRKKEELKINASNTLFFLGSKNICWAQVRMTNCFRWPWKRCSLAHETFNAKSRKPLENQDKLVILATTTLPHKVKVPQPGEGIQNLLPYQEK
jgi:hypothetical protein